MKKTKLISQLAISTTLAVALWNLGTAITRAQKGSDSIFLLDATCVNAGPGRWRYNVKNISVGRAVYKSYWYMSPGSDYSTITCRIRPKNPDEKDYNFQTLFLEFGMRDNDVGSPGVTVTVYLDGKRGPSKSVLPGQKESIEVNITNVSNISVETECNDKEKYCDRVYFWQASLQTSSSSPNPDTNPDTSQPIPPPAIENNTNRLPTLPPPPPSNSPNQNQSF